MIEVKWEQLTNEELNSHTLAIRNRYEIGFTDYEPKFLKRGFARLIMRKDLISLLELWSKIMRDRDFFMGGIDELTVNLTEIFRNPEIGIKLRDDVLPDLKLQGGGYMACRMFIRRRSLRHGYCTQTCKHACIH